MTTRTETNDVEALLTVITREDLEGTIAQLRAAINVFLKNPKLAIAENAKALLESIDNKSKKITAQAALAHNKLDQFEKTAEAKALAKMHEREQRWTGYAEHLKEQLASCNRELEQARTSPAGGRAAHGFAQPRGAEEPLQLTQQQKTAVRQALHNAWPYVKDPISYLLTYPGPITFELIKQTIPLQRLGIHYSVHNLIYHATYKALLNERDKYRAKGPYAGLYDHIYNVHSAMMDAVGL